MLHSSSYRCNFGNISSQRTSRNRTRMTYNSSNNHIWNIVRSWQRNIPRIWFFFWNKKFYLTAGLVLRQDMCMVACVSLKRVVWRLFLNIYRFIFSKIKVYNCIWRIFCKNILIWNTRRYYSNWLWGFVYT